MTAPALSILDLLHFDAPTQEQKTALLAMADFTKETNTDDFFILSGAAGTGKSSIMSALVGWLNQKDVAYQIAAPTGRAARIIGRKTNTLASTVHSLIYKAVPNPETGVVHFKMKLMDEDTRTIFIIDEASMVAAKPNREDALFVAPDSLLSDLARFVKGCNPANKIIFLGDRNQLPPVGEQDSYALQPEYLQKTFSWTGNRHFLTEVKRQEDGSRILKNARQLREAVEAFTKPPVLDAPSVGHNTWQTAKHFADTFRKDGAGSLVAIGRSHKQNRIFNEAVREKMFGSGAPLIRPGDLMLVTQNWNRNGERLYNGDHVVVEEVALDQQETVGGLHFCAVKLRYKKMDDTEGVLEDYMLLDCLLADNGKVEGTKEKVLRHERNAKNVRYRESGNPEDDKYVGALRLMYGYAITCNKAQGGEWEKVYVNTFGVQDAKWLYTAVTRAKEELYKF